MSFIAMSTKNPLGQRPYMQMGLAGDFDFPGAPVPVRRAPELAGNAIKGAWVHPPAIVEEPSPWKAEQPVMMLGQAAVTSTQTVVPTVNTTPAIASVAASGQPVWTAWFSAQTLVPGIPNWGLVVGAVALVALFKAGK